MVKIQLRWIQKKGRRRYKKEYRWIIKCSAITLACLLLMVLYLIFRPKVVKELTIEAGNSLPEVSEFLLREYGDAHFSQEWQEILNLNTVEDYEIGIMIYGLEYTSILHVVDTTAPNVITRDAQLYENNTLPPEAFIERIDDVTSTTVAYASPPDFSTAGIKSVDLMVVDEGGNTTRILAKAEVVKDTEPPVIHGVEELWATMGGSISYKKNVTVTDNNDPNAVLAIDSSRVDLYRVGNYPVIYTAQDNAGNVSRAETIVHVKAPDPGAVTEDLVNRRADEILGQITREGMGKYETAEAIFNWVHENIRWSDNISGANWIQNAYYGLYEQKGDCHVFAGASRCLLTRAGIDNMDIGFSNSDRTHYWNLINLGEGWYHFDATRRSDGSSFFYSTDEELRAYSEAHDGSHAYDPGQYPRIR